MQFKPGILVIDDEEGIKKLLATILTEKGYNVDTAAKRAPWKKVHGKEFA